MSTRFRPHDLLRVAASCASEYLVLEEPAAMIAVAESLKHAPLVVVRRALTRNGMAPVGIRGEERSQRFAAWLDPRCIRNIITPESLRMSPATRDLPAFEALQQLEKRWCSLDLPWGPGGSVGFELASGAATVTKVSDLDIVLRARQGLSHQELRDIGDQCKGLPSAVDVQIETPFGAFVLREYLDTKGRLLLRTACGPMLVYDPWRLPEPWRLPA